MSEPSPGRISARKMDRFLHRHDLRDDGSADVEPRSSATGSYFIASGLESAGIPALEIWADMVDGRRWDADRCGSG